MPWGITIGGAMAAFAKDAKRHGAAVAWTAAGISTVGLLTYVWREQRRVGTKGPAPDMPAHVELELPDHPGVNTVLDAGKGYRVRSRERAFGQARTIVGIVQAIDRYHAVRPGAPDVMVLDISRRGGGPMPPHKSHQTGRDVDIRNPGWPPTTNYAALWDLVRAFGEDPEVQVMFVDRGVQEELGRVADAAGQSARAAELLQVRGGSRVKHWAGHKNHVHVRFRGGVAA